MGSATSNPDDRPEQVALVLRSVNRSIGRLVEFLGDLDSAVVRGALDALESLGSQSIVGPLADGLLCAFSPEHRARIIACLLRHDHFGSNHTLRALGGALQCETNGIVRTLLLVAISRLMMRQVQPCHEPSSSAPVVSGVWIEGNVIGPETRLGYQPVDRASQWDYLVMIPLIEPGSTWIGIAEFERRRLLESGSTSDDRRGEIPVTCELVLEVVRKHVAGFIIMSWLADVRVASSIVEHLVFVALFAVSVPAPAFEPEDVNSETLESQRCRPWAIGALC